ncbi:testis-expressed protein 2 isoform X2 [Hyposmocoma kahamanoa]|uniref:testis-expressed protein 2 isoform X2 n=1 Tax=Hyposmocoma kahamanoa TaxID=1477025 RepID=UPI000E6D9E2F|nr:testis-expressed protein 2 isoform X2 [Hyposmocoma kahamanoa]
MEVSGTPPAKTPGASTSFSFRYNANNEELEELFEACEDDPPTPQFDGSPVVQSENASPKRGDKTPSILDKYFKSIRAEKFEDKPSETKDSKPAEENRTPPKEVSSSPMNFGTPPSKKNTPTVDTSTSQKTLLFNFTLYILTFLIFISYFLFPESNIWNGFLLGIWCFYFASNFKQWLLDNYFCDWELKKDNFFQLKRSSAMPMTYTIPSIKEHKPIKKIEGWINHYRYPDYDPYSYHVNKTLTAFMKLEGCNLRISYTKTKIRKRALWDEKIENVDFYQHRLYNLTGARIILLPKGLVKRRHWSKKYPICIILNENEKIQVLEKETAPSERKSDLNRSDEKKKQAESSHDVESTETNTSPEKKRKFVWRRRDKRGALEKEGSISHSEGEVGKEGLRHRIVRKMHRDKKTDNVSTSTEPQESHSAFPDPSCARSTEFVDTEVDHRKSLTSTNDDEDLDDTELSRIKEFLEETELETGADNVTDGEWSIHIRESKDKHGILYLFSRTGRDKHEWFRRISSAIEEARIPSSPETSAAEDKSSTDVSHDHKEGIEMAIYKLSEKETVAFGKSTTPKLPDISTEGLSLTTSAKPITATIESHEKSFWPYLLKIIQHLKVPPTPCECRMLPAEVTWLNTIMARVVYDVLRNQTLIAALQKRVQKKLHTLKLPSFMSPLMVTEMSLAGACPLVERVSLPSWDERGVWLDADVRYDGGAYITILTQINLMKLKERNSSLEEQLLTAESLLDPDNSVTGLMTERNVLRKRKPAIYDSEMEDSAESSDDNDDLPIRPVDSDVNFVSESTVTSGSEGPTSSSKKKFMRMVDKIASNKYFQQVIDYKYVKRAMEGLSNTDIKLQLEVQGLEGRIVLNLPPPPHDRLWFGFRSNPQLVLKARPAVGTRALRFAHISNWIEQRLIKEFEKVLVLPNMEDIIIDIMSPTPMEFE